LKMAKSKAFGNKMKTNTKKGSVKIIFSRF
jgi:hypothetical protein